MSDSPTYTRQTDAKLVRELHTAEQAYNAALRRCSEARMHVVVELRQGPMIAVPDVRTRAYREVQP